MKLERQVIPDALSWIDFNRCVLVDHPLAVTEDRQEFSTFIQPTQKQCNIACMRNLLKYVGSSQFCRTCWGWIELCNTMNLPCRTLEDLRRVYVETRDPNSKQFINNSNLIYPDLQHEDHQRYPPVWRHCPHKASFCREHGHMLSAAAQISGC